HPPTTQPHPLSLHDALPILIPAMPNTTPAGQLGRWPARTISTTKTGIRASLAIVSAFGSCASGADTAGASTRRRIRGASGLQTRSEEHTSELQSLAYLVCRL